MLKNILKFSLFMISLLSLAVLYRLVDYRFSEKNNVAIDYTYVINLERSKNRMIYVKENFKKIGLNNYNFFTATDGNDIKIINLNEAGVVALKKSNNGKFNFDKHIKYKIICDDSFSFTYRNTSNNRNWTLGELGCACSHFRVMKDVIKNNYNYAFIFEDDLRLGDHFIEHVGKIKSNYDINCDILWLYHNKFIKKTTPQINRLVSILKNEYNPHISRMITFKALWGMVAYILSQNGAKLILNDLETNGINNSYRGLDDYLAKILTLDRKVLNGCLVNKQSIYLTDIDSDIDSIGNRLLSV